MTYVATTNQLPADNSFEKLYESEVTSVLRFLQRGSGSLEVAEDLTSETMICAARLWSIGHGHEVTPAWLMAVARRRLIDFWRRRETQERFMERQLPQEVPTWHGGELDEFGVIVSSVPIRQRRALFLRYVIGLPHDEIGSWLGISAVGASSLVARGRRSVANELRISERPSHVAF